MTSPFELHLAAVGEANIAIVELNQVIQEAHSKSQQVMDKVIGAVGSEPQNHDAREVLAIIANVEEMIARQMEACATAEARLVSYANGAF